MKKILSLLSLTLTISSAFPQNTNIKTYVIPDSITIANGSKISKAEFLKICNDAWNESFGKMTTEDKKLLQDVKIEFIIPKEEEVIKPKLLT
jgi:hypothetical protein